MDTTEKQKITLGTITSWGLGIFFTLGAAGAFLDGNGDIGLGFACLGLAILLLPPVRAYAHKITNKTLSTGVRIFIALVLLSAAGASLPDTDIADFNTAIADISEVAESVPTSPLKKQSSINIPRQVKAEIMDRCKIDMDEYGAMIIKGCVDQDVKAYKALQKYGTQHSAAIERCKSEMLDYGWMIIKGCADQDIKAQKALSNY